MIPFPRYRIPVQSVSAREMDTHELIILMPTGPHGASQPFVFMTLAETRRLSLELAKVIAQATASRLAP